MGPGTLENLPQGICYIYVILNFRFCECKKGDDGRNALILDRTIFYPQGGGQPADTGFIHVSGSDLKFVIQDVRSKEGIVSFRSQI